MIEITLFIKTGGPLTKRISLAPDGALISDGSACLMSRGHAHRVRLEDLGQVADLIQSLDSHEAIACGSIRGDLPDQVKVVTQDRLAQLDGAASRDTIARIGSYISYTAGRSALALIDVDTKGMPDTVRTRIKEAGGFSAALVSVLSDMETTGRIVRRSTSTGIIRTDTDEALSGSNGMHIYLHVQDGADVERFLRTLHERCWLAGYGWHMVGAGGQLLDRSLVDRMVYAPERLVFEGAPVLVSPLAQDQEARRPIVFDHPPLDTKEACPPLRIVEQARLKDLKNKSANTLAPDRAKARDHFIECHTECLARRVVEKQCEGTLLPDLALPWDDAEFAGCTVADILTDPARFVGATMADPLEGPDYGSCKAKVMRRPDGSPWINSFAHGHTVYELRYDARAVSALIELAPASETPDLYVRLVANADLNAAESEAIRDRVAQLSGVNKRTLERTLKAFRDKQAERTEQAECDRKAAERRDPRPQINAPAPDAEWIPQMDVLNDVLGTSTAPEPPMRDLDGAMTQVRSRPVWGLHTLTARGSNQEETEETRLPAPEQPLLTRLDDVGLAELIERHVEYVDAVGRSVHLGMPFVKHYLRRNDGALPVAAAVTTLPMVLPIGTILSGRGLDRRRKIVFRVPGELQRLLPQAADCTASAVAEAQRFLADDWLRDVSTGYDGKCVLIAETLTVLERLLLPERPGFIISGGQRGTGKTTSQNMIAMALFGHRAPAAAWSSSEEERRKALFAYFAEGVPFIVWDNIPRGAAISCPSIEKALTADTISDRVLGLSEFRTVPATTVQAATGNNITARGDLASRTLSARLIVDRPDPENRKFHHSDPLAWTEANRGQILQALYIVLLGNPRLGDVDPPAAKTRFKAWYHLVGSAVEHAAKQHTGHVAAATMDAHKTCKPSMIDFSQMFLAGEADEEQTNGLIIVLDVLRKEWPYGCPAREIATHAGQLNEAAIEFRAALEEASGKSIKVITATTITWRLKALVDAPVQMPDGVFALRFLSNDKESGVFTVRKIK
jgi:hypothetical protein